MIEAQTLTDAFSKLVVVPVASARGGDIYGSVLHEGVVVTFVRTRPGVSVSGEEERQLLQELGVSKRYVLKLAKCPKSKSDFVRERKRA